MARKRVIKRLMWLQTKYVIAQEMEITVFIFMYMTDVYMKHLFFYRRCCVKLPF